MVIPGRSTVASDFDVVESQCREDNQILQIHSSLLHDVKFRSSDEGRIKKTAAAFAKGLFGFEEDLIPILNGLVNVDNVTKKMLDHGGNKSVKEKLNRFWLDIHKRIGAKIDPTQSADKWYSYYFRIMLTKG